MPIATWFASLTSYRIGVGTLQEGQAYTHRTSHDVRHKNDFPIQHETLNPIYNVAKEGQEGELDRKYSRPNERPVSETQNLIQMDLSIDILALDRRLQGFPIDETSTRYLLEQIQQGDNSI